jgi:hypothetical protein
MLFDLLALKEHWSFRIGSCNISFLTPYFFAFPIVTAISIYIVGKVILLGDAKTTSEIQLRSVPDSPPASIFARIMNQRKSLEGAFLVI